MYIGYIIRECHAILYEQPGKAIITLTNLQSGQPTGNCVTDSIYIGILGLEPVFKPSEYLESRLQRNSCPGFKSDTFQSEQKI